jgi:NAD(P)-dependent dehydrogenase (short-subunit alcohol dehydrogenase family)
MTAAAGLPGPAGCVASAGAVNALSRQMAADYGPHGVRVNTIIIGLVLTDVTDLAVHLGSDESTFITASEFTGVGGAQPAGEAPVGG